MKKVLVTATHYSELCAEAKKMFEDRGYEVIENKTESPVLTFSELEEVVPDIDGAIVGLDIWDEAVFKIAKKLKVVAKFGVGVDTIDLVKAKEYGIKVINAKGKNSNAVAEEAVAFILGIMRNIPSLNGSIRKGLWERFVGCELAGKNVGLLGFGAIAQSVAKKLKGFDINILAYDKYPDLDKAR